MRTGRGGAVVNTAREPVARALAEDLAGYGDLTGRVVGGDGRARIVARGAGVLSGTAAVREVAAQVDERLDVTFLLKDGDRFGACEMLGGVAGPLAGLLAMERTALNFLGCLCGVASTTAAFVAATAGTGARIAATRKTTPGLRALEKEAVQHGGGLPHRFGLFDAALVKDNHIRAAGSLTAAVAAVRERLGHVHLIEVETESLAQVQEALDCRAAVIMLDNMDLEQVRAAVRLVAGRAVVEVSGGVTLDRVGDLAGAGVDIISVGALTTAAPWVDIGLDME
jgi:nicotinate-nucleotide pyrophosphorylase (carboxylating)